MERSIFVFILFCGFYNGAQSLQCYVCDDCSRVKDSDLKTCESLISDDDLTTSSTSTSKTPSATSTEPSTLLVTTMAEPSTLGSSTKASTNSSNTRTTTASTLTLREPITVSATTPMMAETTTIPLPSPNVTVSAISNSTESSVVTSTLSPIQLATTSTTTTTASKPTENPVIPTIAMGLTNRTLGPTTANNTMQTAKTIIASTTAIDPSSNATTESLSSETIIQISDGAQNVTQEVFGDLRRSNKSLLRDCVCETDKICECPLTQQRAKRFAANLKIRTLPFKDDEIFACVVDKIRVNGTRITRRGCAFVQKTQETLCEKAGYGLKCRVCGTDKCNGAAASTSLQSFLLLIAFVYVVQYSTF